MMSELLILYVIIAISVFTVCTAFLVILHHDGEPPEDMRPLAFGLLLSPVWPLALVGLMVYALSRLPRILYDVLKPKD